MTYVNLAVRANWLIPTGRTTGRTFEDERFGAGTPLAGHLRDDAGLNFGCPPARPLRIPWIDPSASSGAAALRQRDARS
jgi:hypothetical protein